MTVPKDLYIGYERKCFETRTETIDGRNMQTPSAVGPQLLMDDVNVRRDSAKERRVGLFSPL